MLRILSGLMLAVMASGCAAISDDMQRAEATYEQARYEDTLIWLRDLEDDAPTMDLEMRARYYYLRGMTEYRLGHRLDALHYLAVAREVAGDVQHGAAVDGVDVPRARLAREQREDARSAADVDHDVALGDGGEDGLTKRVRPDRVPEHRDVVVEELGGVVGRRRERGQATTCSLAKASFSFFIPTDLKLTVAIARSPTPSTEITLPFPKALW